MTPSVIDVLLVLVVAGAGIPLVIVAKRWLSKQGDGPLPDETMAELSRRLELEDQRRLEAEQRGSDDDQAR